jgi:hypothetical protein
MNDINKDDKVSGISSLNSSVTNTPFIYSLDGKVKAGD